MKKRLAIILAAALLLCTFAPLCLACDGTRNVSADRWLAFVPGIGVVRVDAAGNVSGCGGSETLSRPRTDWLSAFLDFAAKAADAARSLLSRLKPCKGTFTFTVYGCGHGVGMSQSGAVAYAREGWSYDQILLHYYPGVSLERETPPACITYDGNEWDTQDFLIRAVQQEIGGSTENEEAYKAQAVAVYSVLKSRNYTLAAGDVSCSAAATCKLSAAVRSAVKSVSGQYLSYDGEAVTAAFFAGSAGKTTDSRSVWGVSLPYLAGGADSPEPVSVSVSSITAKGLRSMVQRYNAAHPGETITLSGEPAQWLEIVSCDGARDNAGYVTGIRVGSVTMSGNTFRTVYNLYRPCGTARLHSHCFTIQYA